MNKLLDELKEQLKDAYKNMELHYINYMEAESKVRRLQQEITKLELQEEFKGSDDNESRSY